MMQTKKHSIHRGGAALIAAIVTLAIVASLALTMVRSTLIARANRQTAADRLQAAWLAEAGVERAAARAADDEEYSGETWEVPAEALDGRAGKVEIEITKKRRNTHHPRHGNLPKGRNEAGAVGEGSGDAEVRGKAEVSRQKAEGDALARCPMPTLLPFLLTSHFSLLPSHFFPQPQT